MCCGECESDHSVWNASTRMWVFLLLPYTDMQGCYNDGQCRYAFSRSNRRVALDVALFYLLTESDRLCFLDEMMH
jgi:hypothetical protein